MPPILPLDQLVEQLSFLYKELDISGHNLLPALKKPMESLKSGRAPRAMDLASQIQDPDNWLKIVDEILNEIAGLLPSLREYLQMYQKQGATSADVQKLAESIPGLEKEAQFWKVLSDRARALVKKLRLIEDQDKLSPLARNPIQDAWDDVEAVAR